MGVLKERLEIELKKNLSFWLNYVVNKDANHIITEVSINGTPNTNASLGVMYLSRILFGASSAYLLFKNDAYAELADTAYTRLLEFSNPKGGYYWAKNTSNKIIHDADNTNMAQAFVLYGLLEYARIKPSLALDELIKKQVNFIKNTLYDVENGGYIDGFNEDWVLGKAPTKALGTHLHLLEAFVKLYKYKRSEKTQLLIEELITIITQKFITKDTYDCLHRLTPDWKLLPNEIWAGHNAECSWILCNAANVIENERLQKECNSLSLKMMKGVLDKAWDKNGAVFNVLQNNLPTEAVKIWWVQAETVLGLLNCFRITKENSYRENAIELMNYISTHFIAENGEWYSEIYNSGAPNTSIPIVHFWKSMYHTVRYYTEVNKNLS
ncbi:Mannose or cellobiose epimerase, N-acyl-D-glucosamine 2-epimerase family [Lutibacter agarilyticus]|uniref:Mannose or cellobiose epimerase, N-acyl-D-glucosamine 2-epimerase family n=1 Tax=Lutibacter agarilyticus TaxID=1109740 RepID=A0A238XYT5_9FLAO|nr:AGE family epimerase/isomerase [Lutibacter agarilyticus]SNR63514.1 Mannose or cellobiose epimerase, N-acyl-D-glucosamine 2-epimerase family [Lutibacter agarilyticus]